MFTILLLAVAGAARAAPPEFLASESGFPGAATVRSFGESGDLVWATVDVPYLGIDGARKSAPARLYAYRNDAALGTRRPVLFFGYYEVPLDQARHWTERGWFVVSPHFDTGTAASVVIGDSFNHNRALLQWTRRLPEVDRSRLHLNGGSQGAYMGLALAAEFLPVTSVSAFSPVFNWAYCVGYWEENKEATQFGSVPWPESPLPILAALQPLNDLLFDILGSDLTAEVWLRISPLDMLDRIDCPVLVYVATGDMLTPGEHLTLQAAPTLPPDEFPAAYVRDFQSLTQVPAARQRLEEAVPAGDLFLTDVPLQEGMFEITLEMFQNPETMPPPPPPLDLPWSSERQWSLVVLQEGPPATYSGHTRLRWNPFPTSFAANDKATTPAVDLLRAAKLEVLLRRYAGEEDETLRFAETGEVVRRLNDPELERLDVLTGLLDYADYGTAHQARLETLYESASRQPWGEPPLDLEVLRSERRALLESLGLGEPSSAATLGILLR